MNISSMTGFGRSSGHCEIGENVFDWAFEAKSVNAKNFDFKARLPQVLENLSGELKAIAQKYFERGTISVSLDMKTEQNSDNMKINSELLNKLAVVSREFCEKEKLQLPTMGELLNVNGVIEIERKSFDDETLAALGEELKSGFEKCCAELQHDRRLEGEKIAGVLSRLLQKIKTIVGEIVGKADKMPEQIAEKLKQQIKEFLGENADVSEERLAQEIVFLVNRADIREETDRLQVHIKTAEKLLADGQSVGRRLDFLCQELNREANTTCSKAADVEIINCGMELKATIEQFREQVQNME